MATTYGLKNPIRGLTFISDIFVPKNLHWNNMKRSNAIMREHYKPAPERYPLADIALACAIGFALAMLLVTWWTS